MPRGVTQYPQLFIPPDVRPAIPTRQQRGRSRNPRGTQNDIDMQPQQQAEPQLEQLTRSRSRSHRHSTQPVQAIDMQPHQEPEIEQMTRSRSRRFKSKVLQVPGTTPPGANQQGRQPIVIPPETPGQPRRTADTTWEFFRNKQGAEPPAPPPSDGQKPKRKPKKEVIKQVKQTTRRPKKKGVTNTTEQDNWTGAWATAIVLTRQPIRLRPTLRNQDGNGKQVL